MCEKFFSHQRTANSDKVGLAAFHMLNKAQLWGHHIELAYLELNWHEFKDLCSIWFGHPTQNNPLGDLVLLHQISTVELYQKAFQKKLARASKVVRVDQQISLFTTGLTEALRLEVELLAPTDLA
ncbi:uncharacterized protein [Aristolochia californica]|uniref:uncharacterized protein n=1 Tax=Aristolochia californica TaxID=171875 RepID=UPI0035E01693